MTTVAANRPLIVATPNRPTASSPADTKLSSAAAYQPGLTNTVDIVRTGAAVGQSAGAFAFTPPVIVDVFKSSIRSGFSITNLAWFVIPSAIRNVRDVMSDKISAGRAAANVATETTFGVGKGIVAGVVVQSLSIATGPLLGLLPISPAILPFVGIGVALGGLVASYWGMNKLIRNSGIDQKMADTLTGVFGGDKPGTTTAPKVQ